MSNYRRKTKPGLAPTTTDGRTWNPWSKSELVWLLKKYAHFSNATLATALGKTKKSIVSKANKLRLQKTPARLSAMGRENLKNRKDRQCPKK